jgi:1,2-diacylglycerol 3-alpha-glucosyltransferase
MNILILNPILYTAEKNIIPKVNSIKDCMIYNLAMGFKNIGHQVTLVAASEYKPLIDETYEFEVIFINSNFKKILLPSVLPFQFGLIPFLYKNLKKFDLIISSEVFAFPSLFTAILAPKKTIIWQELGGHNRKFKKIPSLLWYNIISKIFIHKTLIIPRSIRAMEFIKRYTKNVSSEYVEHGLDIQRFKISEIKKDQLIVVSQLINRKNIDSIIDKFSRYSVKYDDCKTKLIIIGKGDQESILKKKCAALNIVGQVEFKGFLTHYELLPMLSESKALLIDTKQDLNMVTISEAVACGIPVLTNMVPYSSDYIKKEQLGIAKQDWKEDEIHQIILNNTFYVNNCVAYRNELSNQNTALKLIEGFAKKNL